MNRDECPLCHDEAEHPIPRADGRTVSWLITQLTEYRDKYGDGTVDLLTETHSDDGAVEMRIEQPLGGVAVGINHALDPKLPRYKLLPVMK